MKGYKYIQNINYLSSYIKLSIKLLAIYKIKIIYK